MMVRLYLLVLTLLTFNLVACQAAEEQPVETAVPSQPTALPTATKESTSPTPLMIASESEPGERLLLSARVVDRQTGNPIPEATLFLRHTDDAGYYDEDAAGLPRLNGTAVTAENGRVAVNTILPGYYADSSGGTRHIHATISAEGYEPIERVILFDNDPNLTAAERSWELAIVAEMVQNGADGWQTEIEIGLNPASSSGGQTFHLIPEQTAVTYEVQEEFTAEAMWLERHGLTAGFTTAVGRTSEVQGELQLDLSQSPPQLGDNLLTANLLSLTSDQEGRDNTVRRDVFGDGRYGEATLVLTALESLPDDWQDNQPVELVAEGELTMRETTQPVQLDISATLDGATLHGTAVTQIKMTDFGFTPPSLLGIVTVSDDVLLTLSFTFEIADESGE